MYEKQINLLLALERLHPKVKWVTSITRHADETLIMPTYFFCKWRLVKRTDQKCENKEDTKMLRAK
jgi:hypothetical protein